MTHMRSLGLRIAIFGTIGGGIVGLLTLGRRRRLTAADITAMDDKAFGAHLHSIGLDKQVQRALARLHRGAP